MVRIFKLAACYRGCAVGVWMNGVVYLVIIGMVFCWDIECIACSNGYSVMLLASFYLCPFTCVLLLVSLGIV